MDLRAALVAVLLAIGLAACSGTSSPGDGGDATAALDGGDGALDVPVQGDAAQMDVPAGDAAGMDATARDVPAADATGRDAVADAPRGCRTGAECSAGELCVFDAPGCGITGLCRMDFPCGRVSMLYCGCDGTSFFDACAGVPAPWLARGACPDGGAPGADSGGGPCITGGLPCSAGLTCCGDGCVNLSNDPLHCGSCEARCQGATAMCLGGACAAPTCAPACSAGQSCCLVNHAGPSGPPTCYDGPTCPVGCPLCR
jgi:hypothetical protein